MQKETRKEKQEDPQYYATNRYRSDKTQRAIAADDWDMNNHPTPTQRGTPRNFKHPAGILVPVVNPNRCEGKGPCAEICPSYVFEMGVMTPAQRAGLSIKGTVKGFVHGWKQVQVINPDACSACGLCVTVCPEKAITLARNSTGSVNRLSSAAG